MEEVGFHVYLMGEGGLLKVVETTTHGQNSPDAIPICMTWAGHEFLDATRDASRWESLKKLVANKTGALSFEVLKFAAIESAKAGLNVFT